MSNSYDGAPRDVNALIVEKLSKYPLEVRQLAVRAIQLSETLPEPAVADQLMALVRKLARSQEAQGR